MEPGRRARRDAEPAIAQQVVGAWRGLTGLQQVALQLVFEDRPPPSSISRALEALGAKGLLERKLDGRGWMLIDPVQRAWLKRNPQAGIKRAQPGY